MLYYNTVSPTVQVMPTYNKTYASRGHKDSGKHKLDAKSQHQVPRQGGEELCCITAALAPQPHLSLLCSAARLSAPKQAPSTDFSKQHDERTTSQSLVLYSSLHRLIHTDLIGLTCFFSI